MSERKPIDWTRPLRVVGTHERVEDTTIDWRGRRHVRIEQEPGFFLLYRVNPMNGRTMAPDADLTVENIPPEPRIVEMWGIAREVRGPYEIKGLYDTRGQAQKAIDGCKPHLSPEFGPMRIAKVLIEEPGE